MRIPTGNGLREAPPRVGFPVETRRARTGKFQGAGAIVGPEDVRAIAAVIRGATVAAVSLRTVA